MDCKFFRKCQKNFAYCTHSATKCHHCTEPLKGQERYLAKYFFVLANVFTMSLYGLRRTMYCNTKIYCETEGNKKITLTTGKRELLPPKCSQNFISFLSLHTSQMCNVQLTLKLAIKQLLSSQKRASVSHV